MHYKKKIFKLVLFLLIGSSPFFAFSHSTTNSSTILVQGKFGNWVLQIRASLTAFENEVNTRFTIDGYKTPDEFKERVVEFLSENIKISFDKNKPIVFEKSSVKLGHETVVLFYFNAPYEFKNLEIQNSSFTNIYNSKNALLVFKDGLQKRNFFLDKTNQFKINLVVKGNTLEELNKKKTTFNYYSILLFIGVLSAIVYLIYRSNKFKSQKIPI